MKELEFTITADTYEAGNTLLPLLAEFERRQNIRVHLTVQLFHNAWADLMQAALYGRGPDVSEVGTTWLGSLAAMNAIRPFTRMEVRDLGGEEAFLPASWQSCLLTGDPRPWAIPWICGTRTLYYRADLLEKAGLPDPETAFRDHAALEQTLRKLSAQGIAAPLALSVARRANLVHEASSWIWSRGGDIVAENGKKVLFNQPQSMDGLAEYFGLCRYLSPYTQIDTNPLGMLYRNKPAVALGGTWLTRVEQSEHPELFAGWEAASVPGVPFVGGTNLVIWNHSAQAEAAYLLIEFLTSQQPKFPYMPHARILPTRLSALNTLSAEGDPFIQAYIRAMEQGRGYPSVRLWGRVEDNLTGALASIWNDVLAANCTNMDEILHKHLDPLASRLNQILES